MRTPTRRTIAERAKEVEGLIELQVREYFSLKVNDSSAARRLDL
jgi:hypothetical protein